MIEDAFKGMFAGLTGFLLLVGLGVKFELFYRGRISCFRFIGEGEGANLMKNAFKAFLN